MPAWCSARTSCFSSRLAAAAPAQPRTWSSTPPGHHPAGDHNICWWAQHNNAHAATRASPYSGMLRSRAAARSPAPPVAKRDMGAMKEMWE